MPFVKGQPNPGKGRPKGIANASTERARMAIASLIDNNAGNLLKWLERVAEDNPKDAIRAFIDICEYHIPKLARTESQVTMDASVEHKSVGSIVDQLPDNVLDKIDAALPPTDAIN